jgi:hypothetical protein
MDTKDILIYESGDGGEISIVANDLELSETLYQQVYLALFGGNVEANTKNNILVNEERLDWWGNILFHRAESTKQFNSNTERALLEIVLNSSGRLKIIQSVNDDLKYLNDLLTFTVDVQFFDVNKIRITVLFRQKGSQEDKVLQLVYNNAKNELITEKII